MDRAFIADMLVAHFEWEEPTKANRATWIDTNNQKSGPGHFLRRKNDSYVRIEPVEGDKQIYKQLENSLKNNAKMPQAHIVVVLDADDPAGSTNVGSGREQSFSQLLTRLHATPCSDTPLAYQLDCTLISLVVWKCSAAPPNTPGVPEQECLERIICSALGARFPQRAARVESWLHARVPEQELPTLESDPKAHALSYLAGWFSNYGGLDALYSGLWRNSQYALKEHLWNALDDMTKTVFRWVDDPTQWPVTSTKST